MSPAGDPPLSLFDALTSTSPAGTQGNDGSTRAASVRTLTLVRLINMVKHAFNEIGTVTVEGEVHRPNTRATAVYFVLKDRAAQINVALPTASARGSRVREGERVAVTGRLDFSSERGAAQLRASHVVPVGAGAIAAMLAEVLDRLRSDGLVDRKKRTIPLLPRCVGVICGAEAAVKNDIEAVIAHRFPGFPVLFREVTVSGQGAAEMIERAMHSLAREPGVDVIVLARGGGDATQLLPFSDEQLCRAIASCPVPVVSAIGHDADRPLSDHVADHRAGTPSIAAAMVIPDLAALSRLLEERFRSCRQATLVAVERAGTRLDRVDWRHASQRLLAESERRISEVEWRRALDRRVDVADARLGAIRWDEPLPRRIVTGHNRLLSAWALIEAMSPQRVLDRGYAVVRSVDTGTGSDGVPGRRVVRNISELSVGESVTIDVRTGTFHATVSALGPTT